MHFGVQRRRFAIVRWVAVGCWFGAMPLVGCECEPEPGTDAAVTDAGPQHDAAGTDARRTDTARTDTARPDTHVADTHVADTHVADTQGTDTTVTDAGQQDVIVVVDAAGTDSTVVDSAVPHDAATGNDANANGPVFWLTTLIVNDQESALVPNSIFGGVARAATKMRELQTAAASYSPALQTGETLQGVGTLTLGGGDSYGAGAQFRASLDHGTPYYDALAMQEMNFDALAIGNHDFDFGPAIFANFIESFTDPVPFLSANIDVSNEAELAPLATAGRIASRTVISTGGQQVGVVSVITEDLPRLSTIGAVTVSDKIAAINAEVAALENAGVNKIVLISHNQSLYNDLPLIPQLSGVDIFFTAGGHELLANDSTLLFPYDASSASRHFPMWATDAESVLVPIITTNGAYKYIGRLVAKFDAAGHLVDIDDALTDPVRIVSVAGSDLATPDTVVDSTVVQPVQAAIAGLQANQIAVTEVPLDGRRSNVRTIETNEGNLIADAIRWTADSYSNEHSMPYVDVALTNGGGIRNNNVIPAGPLTEWDTFNMLPFSNFVAVVPGVTHAEFKAILENAVSAVQYGDGRFAQVSGFWFVWDPDGAPRAVAADGTVTAEGSRVVWAQTDPGVPIVQNGVVLTPTATLDVATLDFLVVGGDGYPFFDHAYTRILKSYQQALYDYLVDPVGVAGLVERSQYPEWGDGRIYRRNTVRAVDYPVIAHGGRLQVFAAPLIDSAGSPAVTSVTIGGVEQTTAWVSGWGGKLTIDVVEDTTPVGTQDLVITTTTGAFAAFPLTVIDLVVNEVDADTPAADTAEFVELYTGVSSAVSLKGYVVVFWNGNNNLAYDAIDLTASTGTDGLYLIGPSTTLAHMPDQIFTSSIQNGPDAVAVYQGYASQFPSTAIVDNVSNPLLDALVYDGAGLGDTVTVLGALLGTGAEAVTVTETVNGTDSMQRCSAARLDGRSFEIVTPASPGVANVCP